MIEIKEIEEMIEEDKQEKIETKIRETIIDVVVGMKNTIVDHLAMNRDVEEDDLQLEKMYFISGFVWSFGWFIESIKEQVVEEVKEKKKKTTKKE